MCQKQIRETNLSMLISLGYTVGKIVTALGAETSSRGITLSSRDLDTIISSFRLNEVSLSEIDNLYGKSVFNSLDSVEKKSSNVLNSTSTNSCFECKHTASELERYRSECSKLRDGNRRYSIQNHRMNDEIRELRYRLDEKERRRRSLENENNSLRAEVGELRATAEKHIAKAQQVKLRKESKRKKGIATCLNRSITQERTVSSSSQASLTAEFSTAVTATYDQ